MLSELPSIAIFSLFIFKIYVYFWLLWSSLLRVGFSSFGEWGLLSSCGALASHRSGSSCC